jgi:hypothetical protein
MGMERHEVPTIFVRGFASPLEVAYADRALQVALLRARTVRYVILWVDVEGASPALVEIEVETDDSLVNASATGATVRAAADRSIAKLIADLARSLAESA